MRDLVFVYIKKKYKAEPEYPWRKYDTNAVFRHGDDKKWFALVMGVQKGKLGLDGEEYIDVINREVTETDIPYTYTDRKLSITLLMRIRLLNRYEPDKFTFGVLKKEYGIYAVRGREESRTA